MRGESGNQSLQKHARGSFEEAHQRRGCQCRAWGHGKSRTRKVLLGVDRAQDVSYGSFTLWEERILVCPRGCWHWHKRAWKVGCDLKTNLATKCLHPPPNSGCPLLGNSWWEDLVWISGRCRNLRVESRLAQRDPSLRRRTLIHACIHLKLRKAV